jgi:hypothetical protein
VAQTNQIASWSATRRRIGWQQLVGWVGGDVVAVWWCVAVFFLVWWRCEARAGMLVQQLHQDNTKFTTLSSQPRPLGQGMSSLLASGKFLPTVHGFHPGLHPTFEHSSTVEHMFKD